MCAPQQSILKTNHRKRIFPSGAPPTANSKQKNKINLPVGLKFQLTQQSFGRLAFHDSRHKKNANGENTE
jgi:hypothetical protein